MSIACQFFWPQELKFKPARRSASAKSFGTGLCGGFFENWRQTISESSKKAPFVIARKPLVTTRTAGCCEWQWRRKAPMPFSCSDFGALDVCSKLPENGSKSSFGAGRCPAPKGGHTVAHRGGQGALLCKRHIGWDTTSRRNRMCAFTACVRFLRLPQPAGLRSLLNWEKKAPSEMVKTKEIQTLRAGTVIAVPALFL